uniref:Uncharacterized protein n=1 Tax=Trichogramma kaykai TaxID=54128 RepID=A0ABD2WVE8_9HYME
MLRNGANPNLADAEGSTSLHIICKSVIYDDDYAKRFFEINDEMQQTMQTDARDNEGRTPLQSAVGNLKPNMVHLLLNRGADLSIFVFPRGNDFCTGYDESNYHSNKLELASKALAVVKRLEKRGYELVRSDVMTIMKIFANYELLEKSSDLEKCLHDGGIFSHEVKQMMINPSLSELVRKDAKRILELTRYQLPILRCEIVIQKLKNEDLCNVCLATLQSL